jgi:hypothetical protein
MFASAIICRARTGTETTRSTATAPATTLRSRQVLLATAPAAGGALGARPQRLSTIQNV